MLSKLKSKFTTIFNFNLTHEERKEINLRIERNNTNRLKYISIIIFILFLGLYLSTFLDSKAENLVYLRIISRNIYFSVALMALMAFILSYEYLPKNPKFSLTLWYFVLSCLYAFAIWIGIFAQLEYPAVTFCVFLLALPLLFIDNPYRIITFLIVVCIVFLGLSYTFKSYDIYSLDLSNCVTFFFMSVTIGFYMRSICIKEIINEIKLEEQRDIDDLSLLFNKSCFERKINLMLNEKGILLIIDIDDFKLVNDNYGHIYGDGIIREIGKSLMAVFEKDCLIGRFGGDEFVVYIHNCDDYKHIEEKFFLLTKKINHNVSAPQYLIHISLSCGGAIYPKDACDYLSLLEIADKRLYTIKKNGKSNIKITE